MDSQASAVNSIAAAGNGTQVGADRRIAGVRVVAILEILGALAVGLGVDAFVAPHDRFSSISPHPFFLVVLLAASYYGTAEAVVCALLASGAFLVGHLPAAGVDEDSYSWTLRVMKLPLLWMLAAVMFGQIRDALGRRQERLRAELAEARDQALTLAAAFVDARRVREDLEARIAGQLRTVHAVYRASRAIERKSMGEVLTGVIELVRCIMEPTRFSLFLLNGNVLEAALSEGWKSGDESARLFTADSDLYRLIVQGRKFVSIGDPRHEQALAGEGMLAGPIVNSANGQVVGMLKIEQIPFVQLHPASMQYFQVLCSWIGDAFANARDVEHVPVQVSM
jgi:hypothetical protein